MTRWIIITPLVIVAGLVAGIVLTRAQVAAAPIQPIAYSHKTHVDAGIQCLFCHTGATRTDIAGIPSVQKCIGCHTVIATENEAVQMLTGFWERGEPIPWKRVNHQPEFVFFSHQAHLRAGESCETCHSDVGQMAITKPGVRMDMGWCLNCHMKQTEEKVASLADCLTCHK